MILQCKIQLFSVKTLYEIVYLLLLIFVKFTNQNYKKYKVAIFGNFDYLFND